MNDKRMIITKSFPPTASAIEFHNSLMNVKINADARVKCSDTILINANPEKIWVVLTDIDNWDKWQSEITEPKLIGELKVKSKFTWKTGGAKINSLLHTFERSSAFGWTGETFGIHAIHNWSLKEDGENVIVTVTESMEGFFADIFRKSFNKSLAKGMTNWLGYLKRECEKNEVAG